MNAVLGNYPDLRITRVCAKERQQRWMVHHPVARKPTASVVGGIATPIYIESAFLLKSPIACMD